MSDAKRQRTASPTDEQALTLTIVYGTDEIQRPAPLKVSDIKQTIAETYGTHRFILGGYTKSKTERLQDTVTVQAGEIVYIIVDKGLHELWAQQRQEWKQQWGTEHRSHYWQVIAQIREFATATIRYYNRNFNDPHDAHEFGGDEDHEEWADKYSQRWYFKTNNCCAYSAFDCWIALLLECYVEYVEK